MIADLISILNVVLGVSLVVCWISVLVTMIRQRDLSRSLLSLLPITAFVVGWLNAERLKLQPLMVVWTVLFAVNRVLECYFPKLMA
jgi:hypothetical protein